MKKRLFVWVMILAMMITCAGCGGGNQAEDPGSTEKVLNVGFEYEPDVLDLANYEADTAWEAIKYTHEALLRDVNGQIEYGIADSYEASEDMREYTFHLRESTYSDGTPVTAEDFQYSILRTLDPSRANVNAYKLHCIEGAEAYNMGTGAAEDVGVEVVDEHTIKFTMNQMCFPVVFSQVQFAPFSKTADEAYGQQYGTEAGKLLGNGPYVLTGWVHEGTMVLEKNEKYWNADSINLQKMNITINASGDAAVDLMTAGQLDGARFSTLQPVDTLVSTGQFQNESVCAGYQFFQINHKGKTEETGKWLSNTNFRLALSYALDRESLVKAVYTADEVAYRVTAPSEKGVNGTFDEEYPYTGWNTKPDAEKATAYLEAAMNELGVTSVDEIPTFTILCSDSENNVKCINAISDMWQKTLGVKSVIDAQTVTSMLNKTETGDFDLWKGGKGIGFMDWYTEIAVCFLSDAGAPNFYSNAEYDALCADVISANDWQARKDAMFVLEKYFCENALSLQVSWMQFNYVYRNDVSNIYVTADGYVDLTFADVN